MSTETKNTSLSNNNKAEKQFAHQKILNHMSRCQHLMVITDINVNSKNLVVYTCLKCGLKSNNKNSSIPMRLYHQLQSLYSKTKKENTTIDVYCHPSLAQAIYNGIIKAHPDIPDDIVADYFRIALYMIRKNKMTEEQKQTRIRRLNLPPEFTGWN